MENIELKKTPYNQIHHDLGAKMAEFAGYDMPIQYTGLVEEHNNVRNNVGVFDVSHMGEFRAKGPMAKQFMQYCTVNDVAALSDGKVQYTCLPNGKGGIVDDMLVYRIADDHYFMVPNAANIDKDWAWMSQIAEKFGMTLGEDFKNESEEWAQLAVQGPNALKAMQKLTKANVVDMEYYTFQIITYTVDVYRGKAPLQRNPLWLLLYVSLFPQLIAGPIVRYMDVAAAIEDRNVTAKGMGEGFFRFSLGLGKKVLLANLCGEVLESLPIPAEMSFFSGWLAAALFLLQLYFDFSGYSEMAIGLGRMLGFRFLENFDAPLVSKSVTEFWRRWHMSLGTFFREYVYIPLGGNRVSRGRWVLNMAVVWGLTGIWHGANWNFLLWGLYWGFFMVLERTVLEGVLARTPNFIKHIVTVILAVVGFVFFRNESFPDIALQLKAMFAPWRVALSDPYAVYAVKNNPPLLLACVLCCLPLRKTAEAWLKRRREAGRRNTFRPYVKALLALGITALSVMFLVGQSFNPFLYFRF